MSLANRRKMLLENFSEHGEVCAGVFTPSANTMLHASPNEYTYATIPHTLGEVPHAVYFGWSPELNDRLSEKYPENMESNKYYFRSIVALLLPSDNPYANVWMPGTLSYNIWKTTSGNIQIRTLSNTEIHDTYPVIRVDEHNIYLSGYYEDWTTIYDWTTYLIAGQKYEWIVG